MDTRKEKEGRRKRKRKPPSYTFSKFLIACGATLKLERSVLFCFIFLSWISFSGSRLFTLILSRKSILRRIISLFSYRFDGNKIQNFTEALCKVRYFLCSRTILCEAPWILVPRKVWSTFWYCETKACLLFKFNHYEFNPDSSTILHVRTHCTFNIVLQ